MHYSRLHFTKDPARIRQTIVPKDDTAQIGQRIGLSELDIKQARLLYNCGSNHNLAQEFIPSDDIDSSTMQ